MNYSNVIQTLKNRELISKITDEKKLSEIIKNKSIKVYCGFDPTSDSLHIGHLIPLFCLKHFQNSGHQPIILLGGATGLIGDPSFKDKKRQLNNYKNITKYISKISSQISLFLNVNCNNHVIILNNATWFNKINIINFLQEIGKHFSINKMINKEAIKIRFTRKDIGISFTEFSYNLLQSYDFLYLYNKYKVILQIGGSDQLGNILSGINLIKKIKKKQTFGLTVPLMINSSGKKFGKTEKNTIWLDAKKTSPYKFYQFWINISDNDIYLFLKLITFIDLKKIKNLKNNDNGIPSEKYILANYITKLIHGEKGLISAQRITNSLFSNKSYILHEKDFEQLEQDGIPKIYLDKNINLVNLLVIAKLASSNTQAKNMIISNAISINNKKIINTKYSIQNKDKLYKKFTLLKKGKKNYCLVCWK